MRRRSFVLTALAAFLAAWAAWTAWDRRKVASDPLGTDLVDPPGGNNQSVIGVGQTPIHVEIFGAEHPHTIVLVHGWTQALRFWVRQIRELTRDHRVVAFDLRGHGRSGPGHREDLSVETLADDLEAVLRAHVPAGSRATLVGHSLGAMAIVQWAGRHPDSVAARVSSVVLFNTGVCDLISESLALPIAARLGRFRDPLSLRFLGSAAPLPRLRTPLSATAVRYFALGARASRAEVAFCERMLMECDPHVRGGLGTSMSTLDLHSSLEHLTVPTTVVASEADRLTPPTQAARIAAQLPNLAAVVTLPGVGHMGPIEAPAESTAAIREAARRAPHAGPAE